jgi:serine/threonine protein kinase
MNGICTRCGAPIQAKHRCPECNFLAGEDLDAWLGQNLGGFTLLRQLSSNATSAIYEAKSEQGRAVVKLLHQRLDTEAIERFKREALAIKRLQHPSVVQIFAQGEAWIAMEFVEGETLRERIQGQIFSEKELRALLKPLCEALEEAHQKGIVHRDLSPRNIMIKSDNSPKLLDFGFAGLRGAKTLTERGVVSGTPAYMAPEQWQGLSNADPRSDLYSLAVISYECVSGQLPLNAKTPLEWIKKHSFGQATDLKASMNGRDLSESMYRAIMRALQKNPNERQASVAAFFSELS